MSGNLIASLKTAKNGSNGLDISVLKRLGWKFIHGNWRNSSGQQIGNTSLPRPTCSFDDVLSLAGPDIDRQVDIMTEALKQVENFDVATLALGGSIALLQRVGEI